MMQKEQRTNKTFSLSPFLKSGIWTALAFLFLVVVWIAVSKIVGNEYLFPDFFQTVKIAVSLLGKSEFWLAFITTLARALLAFFGSFLFGAGLATFAYIKPAFSNFFAPIISFLRSLPTMAVLLIILLWSNPTVAPIIVASLVLFPLTYANVYAALGQVDKDLIEMSIVYKVSTTKRVLQLFLPTVLPSVCETGARNLSFALKLIVSAEIMANTFQSIGGEMQTAVLYDQTALLFALTVMVFVFGYILEWGGCVLTKLCFGEDRKK